MKKILLIGTILIIALSSVLIISGSVHAQVSSCPESMPTLDRYNCLQDEYEKLQKNQGTIQKKLNNEDYQQLSLNEKISYINNQVIQTENVINSLHLEILTQDIEIDLLSKEIQTMEDDLSILKQEIYTLQETVDKRVVESYKYSHVGFLELFMDVRNIDNILRKTKYLIETREKDRNALEEYNDKVIDLENNEVLLAEKKLNFRLRETI